MQDWKKAERFYLRAFPGGHMQPGSGNQPGQPGDVRFRERVVFQFDHKVLLEVKETRSPSLSLQRYWLQKITREALMLGRTPLLGIEMDDQHWLAMPVESITVIGGAQ